MTDYNSQVPTWGSTGEAPPSGYSYAEGEQPVDAWDNNFNYNVSEDLSHLTELTNERLDSGQGDDWAARPANPNPGEMFYRNNDGQLRFWREPLNDWGRVLDARNPVFGDGDVNMSDSALYDSTDNVVEFGSRIGGTNNAVDIETQTDSGFHIDGTPDGPRIAPRHNNDIKGTELQWNRVRDAWEFTDSLYINDGAYVNGNEIYHTNNIAADLEYFYKTNTRSPSDGSIVQNTYNNFGGLVPQRVYVESDSSGATAYVQIEYEDGGFKNLSAENGSAVYDEFPTVDGRNLREVTFYFDNQSGGAATMTCQCEGFTIA